MPVAAKRFWGFLGLLGLVFILFLLVKTYTGVELPPDRFVFFDASNETCVLNTVNHPIPASWFQSSGLYCGNVQYRSSFGLSGFVYQQLCAANSLDFHACARVGNDVVAAITVLVLSAFLFAVFYEFGAIAALLVYLGLISTDYVLAYGRNAYWLLFLDLLPFVFAWLWYPVLRQNRKRLLLFFAGLAALVVIKALCGYEIVTCVMTIALAPVVYYEIVFYSAIRQILLRGFSVLVTGVIAFAVAFALHMYQLVVSVGSAPAAWNYIHYKAGWRTLGYIGPDTHRIWDGFLNVADAVAQIQHYFNYNAFTFPPPGTTWMHIYVNHGWMLVIVLLFASASLVLYHLNHRQDKKLLGLGIATFCGLLSTLTWPVLGRGHFVAEFPYSGLIFILPFQIMGYCVTAYVLQLGVFKTIACLRSRCLNKSKPDVP